MNYEQQERPAAAGWELTTTAIWCSDVRQRAVLIVKGDWTSYCCWHKQHEDSAHSQHCQGMRCAHVAAYRDKLLAEESADANHPPAVSAAPV
jgi:hypothetical protein